MSKTPTTTVQVNLVIANRVRSFCVETGLSFSYITTRLLERYINEEFSGSLKDVININAGREPGAGGLAAQNGAKINEK